MVDRSKHGVQYFDRHCRVRCSELKGDSHRVVNGMAPLRVSYTDRIQTLPLSFNLSLPFTSVSILQRYFTLAPEDASAGIADLVIACLRIDPLNRSVKPRCVFLVVLTALLCVFLCIRGC